ncbi:MAG: DUF433 domain-containing protein [Armatimonadetes bacterium]|nr:DUF433 domain-containing protein [Armatimonadota bacterium]
MRSCGQAKGRRRTGGTFCGGGGKPCVRGTRVTVGTIVGLVAAGRGIDEILAAYPYLEREDIAQALTYAADSEIMT